MHLTRDPITGVLCNHCVPIVLRGGHYHLFGAAGGLKQHVHKVGTGTQPFRVSFPQPGPVPNPDGCPATHASPRVLEDAWGTIRTDMLDALVAAGGNLVRVFLSDGVDLSSTGKVTSLHPFVRQNGRWRVAAAIRDGHADAWSSAYFNRLQNFVAEADARGVAVQLCLFTHHDMRSDLDTPDHRYWSLTYWNPDNVDDPEWGADNLVSVSTGYLDKAPEPPQVPPTDKQEIQEEVQKGSLRNQDFLNIARDGLMYVQSAFVQRVLSAVKPHGNVILELNNEPRVLNDATNPTYPTPGMYQARWLSTATGWILAWLQLNGAGWRPLISANASRPRGGAPWDVDVWASRRRRAPYYTDLDAISFHGLTGYGPVTDTSEPHCGKASLPAVARDSIAARVQEHRSRHATKSLILSTDALSHYVQTYPDRNGQPAAVELMRRDGEVITSLGYDEAVSLPTGRARGDLDNWAYDVLRHGFDRDGDGSLAGSVHFQNHSSVIRSFQMIGAAATAAQGAAAREPELAAAGV
jgi:hypothetical protein